MKIATFVLLAIIALIWGTLTVLGGAYLSDRIVVTHYHSILGIAWLIGYPLTAFVLAIFLAIKIWRDAASHFGIVLFSLFFTLFAGAIYLMPLGGGM